MKGNKTKRKDLKLDILLFIIGTILSIGVAFILTFEIPTLNREIQDLQKDFSQGLRNLDYRYINIGRYQETDIAALTTRDLLLQLRSLKLEKTNEYKAIDSDFNSLTIQGLIELADSTDGNKSQLIADFQNMNFYELQSEKIKLGVRSYSDLQSKLKELNVLENEEEKKKNRLFKFTIYGSLFQTLALLLSGASQLISKFNVK